jgi:Ca2+:H+ antiporter
VLPNYTDSSPGPKFTARATAFIAVVSLVLYGTFVFAQAVRHRDYFLPAEGTDDEAVHAARPSNAIAIASAAFALRLPGRRRAAGEGAGTHDRQGVAAMGAPPALVGVIIAAVVLFPEGLAALRAAAPTGCRRASTSRSARRWRASVSPFRPSRSFRSRPAGS